MFVSFNTFLSHIYHIFLFIFAFLICIYEIVFYDVFHLNKAILISTLHCVYVNWDHIKNYQIFKKLKK